MACQAAEKDFRFWMPMEVVKAQKGDMRIGGVATDEESQDIQGEKVFVDGLDISYLLQRGAFNWDHGKGPGDILGEVDIAQKQGTKLYVEGPLYPHVEKAKEVYDLMRSLKESGSKRKLGLSVEGKIKERDTETGKNIRKAWVKNIAVTYNPINQGAWVDLIKSLGNFSFNPCSRGDCEKCTFCEEEVDKSVSSEVGVKEQSPKVTEEHTVAKSEPSLSPPQESKSPVSDKSVSTSEEIKLDTVEKGLKAGHDIPAATGGISGSALREETLEKEKKITTYDVGKKKRKKQGEFTKSELSEYFQDEFNYPERLADMMTDLIFKSIQVQGYVRSRKGRLERVKPFSKELSHEMYRLNTMSDDALMTRARKITHPDKLLHAFWVAKKAGKGELAGYIRSQGHRLGLTNKDFMSAEVPVSSGLKEARRNLGLR